MPMIDKKHIYEQFLRGEPQGLDAIYDNWKAPLMLFARRWASSEVLREEAVMQAFYLLLKHIGNFDHGKQIEAFLFETVKNLCRSAQRKELPVAVTVEETTFESDLTASQSLEAKELRVKHLYLIQKILDKLNEMPQQSRDDFYTYFFESKSFKQIAEERKVSVGTVRQNVKNVQKKLRKFLKNKGLRNF